MNNKTHFAGKHECSLLKQFPANLVKNYLALKYVFSQSYSCMLKFSKFSVDFEHFSVPIKTQKKTSAIPFISRVGYSTLGTPPTTGSGKLFNGLKSRKHLHHLVNLNRGRKKIFNSVHSRKDHLDVY